MYLRIILLFVCTMVYACGGGGGASSGSNPPATGYWTPELNSSWTIQLQGALNKSYNVDVYDIDLFDVSAAEIAELKTLGSRVICYFSAGSYEDWRSDAAIFPDAVKGNALAGWAGEYWLDIRSDDVLDIMEQRIALAASKGCDAVDPDNVDGYTNGSGFPLTYADQLSYNIKLAEMAHNYGLAVGLKNDLDQIDDLVGYFDFAVNESCYDYNECDMLTPFMDDGKAVFGIEYDMTIDQFCADANSRNFNFLYMPLSLDGTGRISCR